MKNISIIILTLALMVSTVKGQQQEETSIEGDFGISLVPQYAIQNGMRIDFDFKLKDKQTLTVAPIMYYARKSNYYYPDATDFSGAGLKVNYRYFPKESVIPQGGYLGMGLNFNYKKMEYETNDYIPYEYDGFGDYIEYGEVSKEESFNQFGYDLLLGYQWLFDDIFTIDLYFGWGFRFSDFDPDAAGNDSYWAETIFDPGFTGFTPVAGLRAGIYLK